MTSPLPLSDLTAHLGYWLRIVSNQVSQAFARRLEEKDVTVAEWVVMRELYDVEALSPSRLAEKMGMTRGAISKLAERLVEKQLLLRQASAEDKRAQSLALSEEARRLVPALAALADQNDAEYFGHLAPDEREMLGRVLKGIVERRGITSIPIG
jgi:DNA-binding MarR family transcriptional regulator